MRLNEKLKEILEKNFPININIKVDTLNGELINDVNKILKLKFYDYYYKIIPSYEYCFSLTSK